MQRIKKAALHLPHIGMRKLKSILAVFVGFWVWQAIRLIIPGLEVHPIYIYIYGIIEIRDSSDKTVSFSRRRLKATFTGLGIGLPMLILSVFLKSLTDTQWLHVTIELSTVLIGALLVLCVAELVGCENFCGLAAAMLVVLVIAHSDGEPIVYAVLRAFQTIIAVFVAWLINVKLFPYPSKNAA